MSPTDEVPDEDVGTAVMTGVMALATFPEFGGTASFSGARKERRTELCTSMSAETWARSIPRATTRCSMPPPAAAHPPGGTKSASTLAERFCQERVSAAVKVAHTLRFGRAHEQ
jgi:hypothetical protein